MLNDVTTSPEAKDTTTSPKEADKRPPCPEIRTRPIGELTLNPKSPRRHNRKKIKNLAGLIKEVGYRVPILVDRDGHVIAGHARILACQELGWTEIPTISVEGLSEAQCKALMIADNRLAEMAEWDDRLLAEQLRDICLAEISFDIEITGFSMGEIDLRIRGLEGEPATEVNKSIDRRDLRARDFWAQVVGAIHDYQRSGEFPASVARSVSRRPVSAPLPQIGGADEE